MDYPKLIISNHMRGSRKFCQRGSNFDNVFFQFDEGRKDTNTTISGPSTARQRMAFRWQADDGTTLNAGFALLF